MTTKKPTHTPGPWMLCESTDARNRGYIRPGPLEPAVCKITETGRAKEWRANARLIAAAPDLLAALKDAQAVINHLAAEGRYFYTSDLRMGLEGAINAAIAKAEAK